MDTVFDVVESRTLREGQRTRVLLRNVVSGEIWQITLDRGAGTGEVGRVIAPEKDTPPSKQQRDVPDEPYCPYCKTVCDHWMFDRRQARKATM